MPNYLLKNDDPVYHFSSGGFDTPAYPGGDGLPIHDGYAQWLFGPGATFNPSEEYRRHGSADFLYAIHISADDDGTSTDASTSPVCRVTQGTGLASDKNAETADGSPHGMWARLPIAERSFQSKPVTETISHALPEGADAEKLAIVAIIDDSINVVRHGFAALKGNGALESRFDYFWHQDGLAHRKDVPVPFGHEWTRDDISPHLADPSEAALVALGLINRGEDYLAPSPLSLGVSHGTFVSELAGGYESDDPAAVNTRLVGVQLPILASQDTSGLSLLAAVCAGIDYVFGRSLAISRAAGTAVPVILNFSYGISSGPRNAYSFLERFVSARIARYRRSLVAELGTEAADCVVQLCVPAGNGLLSRSHVVGKAKRGNPKTAHLQTNLVVQPEDRTSSFVEFWFPKSLRSVDLRLDVPGELAFEADSAPEVDTAEPTIPLTINGNLLKSGCAVMEQARGPKGAFVARLKLDKPLAGLKNEISDDENYWRLTFCLAPTAHFVSGRPAAPAGRWGINLEANADTNAGIEGWILRDESVSGFGQRGRQAYFDDDTYTQSQFDENGDIAVRDDEGSPIKRDGSLSSLATLSGSLGGNVDVYTVGGFVADTQRPAAYSAASRTGEESVDLLLPVERSRVTGGLLGAGTMEGSKRILNGTSMAAPHLARIITSELQLWKSQADASQSLRSRIEGRVEHQPGRPGTVPETREGDVVRKERSRLGNLG